MDVHKSGKVQGTRVLPRKHAKALMGSVSHGTGCRRLRNGHRESDITYLSPALSEHLPPRGQPPRSLPRSMSVSAVKLPRRSPPAAGECGWVTPWAPRESAHSLPKSENVPGASLC